MRFQFDASQAYQLRAIEAVADLFRGQPRVAIDFDAFELGQIYAPIDAHGDAGPVLYLVRETKSTTVGDELRGTENQKIHCGERHFVGALGVDYKVVTSADELP